MGLYEFPSARHPKLHAKIKLSEACYLGWQQSLALLAQLVEAEIPD